VAAGEHTAYPNVGLAAAEAVAAGEVDRAVLICGTGLGMAISANKVHGVRAALCLSEHSARLARLHNDANVLSLGARQLADQFACTILEVFLTTEFEGGRHEGRLEKVRDIEREECEG
jgi:ribose 5-phosphate isomerase B